MEIGKIEIPGINKFIFPNYLDFNIKAYGLCSFGQMMGVVFSFA